MFKNENKGSINTFKLEMKKKTANFEEGNKSFHCKCNVTSIAMGVTRTNGQSHNIAKSWILTNRTPEPRSTNDFSNLLLESLRFANLLKEKC